MSSLRSACQKFASFALLSLALEACGSTTTAPNAGSSGGAGGTTKATGGTPSGGSPGTGGAVGGGGSPGSGGKAGGGGSADAGGTTVSGGSGGSAGRAGGGSNGSGGTATGSGGSTSLPDAAAGGQASSGGTPGTGGAVSSGGKGDFPGSGGAGGGPGGTSGALDSGVGGTAVLTGPCDIYQAGNTPCVAAHSTVRSLYGAYKGSLYQVRRTSDKTTKDIAALTAGGLADSASQEAFCAGTKCTISIIYDQSTQHNDLTLTKGGWIGDRAKEADAAGIKVTVAGHTVYGIHVPQSDGQTGIGYRNNKATGTAKGDEPESMYMVANGKLYNDQCCFDYGNAETNSLNNGKATMESIYFGNCRSWGSGDGQGPWVMSDLEEGLFSGLNAKLNSADKSITSAYVTAMLKGKQHMWAIKSGDSQSGDLTKIYEGAYPSGYDPMKKEGAIVLGTGGDNSFMGVGDFFEGAMTAGYASDATDSAVQANIVAAGYGR